MFFTQISIITLTIQKHIFSQPDRNMETNKRKSYPRSNWHGNRRDNKWNWQIFKEKLQYKNY